MWRRPVPASVVPVDSRRTLDELSAAVLAVAAHRSVRDVLQTIVSTARSLLDCEYAALGVPDDQGGFAEFVVDGISDEQWAAIGPLPRQHGMLGVMLSDPTPQRLRDLHARSAVSLVAGRAPESRRVSRRADPATDDEILGAIFLANPHGRAEFTRRRRAAARRARGARGDRAHQRATVRAGARADARPGAAADRPGTARRRRADAVQPAADRSGRGRARPPRPGSRDRRTRRPSPTLATDATDELRQIVAELRPTGSVAGAGSPRRCARGSRCWIACTARR